jgi:hypothetical protein
MVWLISGVIDCFWHGGSCLLCFLKLFAFGEACALLGGVTFVWATEVTVEF